MGLIANAVQETLHLPSRSLGTVLAEYPRRDFQVRFWDGTTWGTKKKPIFTLVLEHAGAFLKLFVSPRTELSLGEAYIAGDFDIEGDMEAAFELGDYLLKTHTNRRTSRLLGAMRSLEKLGRRKHPDSAPKHAPANLCGAIHSKERDAQAIHFHYDLPPEFFALWLDSRMVYSSAYFARSEQADLDKAQERKLELICRKLRLRRGEYFLDIGCGWGGLLVFAARHFGVRAHGITLSVQQAEIARKRIRDAGLDRQCRVEVCDYRDLEPACQFDKIASVGMIEHVGEALLPEYFNRVWQLLRPGGAFLNSGISSVPSHPRPKGPSFVDHYVFPDGELVPIHTTIGLAERSGFEVRDVQSLREHYALTLRQWVGRLESKAAEARNITDETTYRIWRLYMSGSAHQFRTGALNLHQVLLAKPS
jgi:cyclopropane-fatty-acyl-phospholipid synthase